MLSPWALGVLVDHPPRPSPSHLVCSTKKNKFIISPCNLSNLTRQIIIDFIMALNNTSCINETSSSSSAQELMHSGAPAYKNLLQSDALFQYILETSVSPREPAVLRELREMTSHHPQNRLSLTADCGQFLMLILKLINAKNTIEVGVYTGYSLLSTALVLPEDGKIIAIDINKQNYELGVPFMKKAGVHHKIDFREGMANALLDELMQDEKNMGFFDFVFVDADKINYLNYHERAMKLLKVGGLIGYDNTLWAGSVAAPDDAPFVAYVKHSKPFVLALTPAQTSPWCPLEMA